MRDLHGYSSGVGLLADGVDLGGGSLGGACGREPAQRLRIHARTSIALVLLHWQGCSG